MAIEKLKMAAREAQPRVISMVLWKGVGSVPRLGPDATSRFRAMSHASAMTSTPMRPAESGPKGSPAVLSRSLQQPYPEARVIVLDDDFNTYQHVVESLLRHIPGMDPDRAWQLAHRIDTVGSAVAWSGPLEQAEHYHHLLAAEGLTMAPLERI